MKVNALGQTVEELFDRGKICVKMPVKAVLTADLFEKIECDYQKCEACGLQIEKNVGGFSAFSAEHADSEAKCRKNDRTEDCNNIL